MVERQNLQKEVTAYMENNSVPYHILLTDNLEMEKV
jgi:hypothetical protein